MRMDDVHTNCRSRGADGFAFVIQNQDALALGRRGSGLGYEGIKNSLAVEFDTFFNEDQFDPYENHVSVHTRGWRQANSANHTNSIASSVEIPNLADAQPTYHEGEVLSDGVHEARIVYHMNFDESTLTSGKFTASPWSVNFLENADYAAGSQADWGTGMGTLSVYVDNLFTPIFTTVINVASTLSLDNGRAWVGFTASTGESFYQVHDIMSWQFAALRETQREYPSEIVNPSDVECDGNCDNGPHQCSESSKVSGTCVHK
jgi:hypothetical protein